MSKQENLTVDQLRTGCRKPFPGIRKVGRGVRPDNTVMNKLERAYSEHLEARRLAGEIFAWKFHAITLTIAEPQSAKVARWSPDFCVWTADMVLEFHDTKGHIEDHAKVRIKCASEQYPHPIFTAKKVKGGGWDIEQW